MREKALHVDDFPEEEHPNHYKVFIRTVLTGQEHGYLSLHRTRVEVGGEIRPHKHGLHTETYFIISGEATGLLGDKELKFTPGSVGYAPPGTLHSLKNIGNEPLELIAIFTPPLK